MYVIRRIPLSALSIVVSKTPIGLATHASAGQSSAPSDHLHDTSTHPWAGSSGPIVIPVRALVPEKVKLLE